MELYGVSDVERMLQLSRSAIRRLIASGFVSPARGARREHLFSFQDLIVLRTARALLLANVPARRIGRSLNELRRRLPKSMPLSGLSICAVGEQVVVRKGGTRWHAESGQLLLALDVSLEEGALRIVEVERGKGKEPASRVAAQRHEAKPDGGIGADAQSWFEQAISFEGHDPAKALDAYERCRTLDPDHVEARINLGRLLHQDGRLAEAERVYREALRDRTPDPTLLFNLAVLLEDTGQHDAAIEAYLSAITGDPDLADAHYNLARLYELSGRAQHAIRHLMTYRRLLRADAR
jgi:tetratricopeptide (TPR) repeat protein